MHSESFELFCLLLLTFTSVISFQLITQMGIGMKPLFFLLLPEALSRLIINHRLAAEGSMVFACVSEKVCVTVKYDILHKGIPIDY